MEVKPKTRGEGVDAEEQRKTKEVIRMKISEICKTPEFFPDAEFVEVKNVLNLTFKLVDLRTYNNDKGEGVAMLLHSESGDALKVYTHAKAIVRILTSPEFSEVWENSREDIFLTFREKVSKMGAKYYIIE